MKVNVIGRGMIPGVGILPIRNIELSDQEIKRILNLRTARVYNAENGSMVTFATFTKKKVVKKPAPVVEMPVEPVVEETPITQEVVITSAPILEEVPVEVVVTEPEETKEEYIPAEIETVEEPVEMTEEVEGEPIQEELEEVSTEETIVEEVKDETDEDEKPVTHKKRRRR